MLRLPASCRMDGRGRTGDEGEQSVAPRQRARRTASSFRSGSGQGSEGRTHYPDQRADMEYYTRGLAWPAWTTRSPTASARIWYCLPRSSARFANLLGAKVPRQGARQSLAPAPAGPTPRRHGRAKLRTVRISMCLRGIGMRLNWRVRPSRARSTISAARLTPLREESCAYCRVQPGGGS